VTSERRSIGSQEGRALVDPIPPKDAVPTLRLTRTDQQCTVPRDRVVGLLVGAAVGDALGAPFEFAPRGTFSARLPDRRPDGEGDMIGGGVFDWAPGEFTDDTQMGLALAASLIARDGYDPDELWGRWRTWSHSARDVGSATRSALAHHDWRAVVHDDPERTAGNGSLMRAFPLAIATLGVDDTAARAVTVHQSTLTHAHPAAAWGAWLGVAMMRGALLGDDPLGTLASELDTLSRLDPRHAARFVTMLDPAWGPQDADRDGVGNGSVWGCLAQAVWALRHHGSSQEAIAGAVDLGQDTDTVACVVGAIAGARDGASAIPAGWVRPVHGWLAGPGGTVRHDRETLAAVALELARTSGVAVSD
jgi:ADP-ribosyl-[dinitrogen reductase] hydrolase